MKVINIYKNKMIRSVGIYTIANVINSAIPFLILPILTRYLSPKDYGIISMIGVLVSILTPFIGFNLHTAISRMYYETDKINIQTYIFNCFIVICSSTLIWSVILKIFSRDISSLVSIPQNFIYAILLLSVSQVVVLVVLGLWQVQGQPNRFGVFQISKTILNVSSSLLFVVYFGLGWKGRLYGQLIAASFFMILGFFVLIKNNWFQLKIKKNYIRHALNFGTPLIPHSLSAMIMSVSDRAFISSIVGIEETGIYTVGYQIGMIINILAMSVNQAYVPWLYNRLSSTKGTSKRQIVHYTYAYFIMILLLALLMTFSAPLIFRIFIGEEFNGSLRYVGWVSIGYAFHGMSYIVGAYITYVQKTHWISLITLITAGINLILNYILISINGPIGAAQATSVVYFLLLILIWGVSARLYKMPWKLNW